jgi:hypothetical protein
MSGRVFAIFCTGEVSTKVTAGELRFTAAGRVVDVGSGHPTGTWLRVRGGLQRGVHLLEILDVWIAMSHLPVLVERYIGEGKTKTHKATANQANMNVRRQKRRTSHTWGFSADG